MRGPCRNMGRRQEFDGYQAGSNGNEQQCRRSDSPCNQASNPTFPAFWSQRTVQSAAWRDMAQSLYLNSGSSNEALVGAIRWRIMTMPWPPPKRRR